MPRLTIIESPFAGEIERNKVYLRRCVLHSIDLGETPFASHGFFTQFLDDSQPEQRYLGINLGYHFYPFARLVAFYEDYGWSQGMQMARVHIAGRFPDMKITSRKIGTNEKPREFVKRIPLMAKK